jgi:hypothetical protein
MMKLRLAVALMSVVTLALVAIAIGGNIRIGFDPDHASADRPLHALSAEKRFALLSGRHSNRCSLQAGSLETGAVSGRLQGACCTRIDFAHYKQQLRGLRRYHAVRLIPADPYDVPVGLAQRLVRFDREIRLDRAAQQTYDQAVRLSHEHGPCCCHCWRWTAFAGQAKQLIARRHYEAAQIAAIWDLENGCGGKVSHV